MLTLKTGQFATIKIDAAGVALLKGQAVKFLSSDERVCAVTPDSTGAGCTVYAADGGEDMTAQVLIVSGEDQLGAEDVQVISQDRPPVIVNLVVGVPTDVPA